MSVVFAVGKKEGKRVKTGVFHLMAKKKKKSDEIQSLTAMKSSDHVARPTFHTCKSGEM